MGKIRTKLIGNEEIEKKQAQDAAARRAAKKASSSGSVVSSQEEDVIPSEPELVEGESRDLVSPKKKRKATTTRIRGKKYLGAKRQVKKDEIYTVSQAVALLKKISRAKFDESLEAHLNLVDTTVKGEVTFPHGSGKSVKVTVVDDEVLSAIESGKINFDVLITHPSFMPKLAKFARILGPKGLMPNPKNGTVSQEPEEVAKKYAGGSIRFKTEGKFPIIHQVVGKKSFEEKQLEENVAAFLKAVDSKNITSAYLKTTMSPSVQIQIENS